MMNSASDLVSQVMLNLKGCPESAAMHGLRKAFSRLCRETGCWRSSFSFVLTAAPTEQKDRWFECDVPTLPVDAELSGVKMLFFEKADGAGGHGGPMRLWPGQYEMRSGTSGLVLRLAAGVSPAIGDRFTLDAEFMPEEFGSTLEQIPLGVVQVCAAAAVPLAAQLLAEQLGRPWSDRETAARMYAEASNAKRLMLYKLYAGHTEATATVRTDIVEG